VISVVLPVRDGAPHVAEALASAAAAGADEIVAVDGASRDSTVAIAASSARTRLLDQQGPSLEDAYNEGIAAARGDRLAFMGHDDVYEPEALTELDSALEETGAGAVFGRVAFELMGDGPPPGFRAELLEGPRDVLLLETLLIRREVAEELGPLRHAIGHDVDWIARLNDSGTPIARVQTLVVRKRLRADSASHRAAAHDPQLLVRVLRDVVARRVANRP
jgi:glycosyltransferase involved in cell wall biosynthesis